MKRSAPHALALSNSARITQLTVGDGTLDLRANEHTQMPDVGSRAHLILVVSADGFPDRIHQVCKDQGFAFVFEIRDDGFGRFFLVHDPDGYPSRSTSAPEHGGIGTPGTFDACFSFWTIRMSLIVSLEGCRARAPSHCFRPDPDRRRRSARERGNCHHRRDRLGILWWR